MQILISCAKDMASREDVLEQNGLTTADMASWPATRPLFWDNAVRTASEMAGLSVSEISRLLGCNEKIAELNRTRFAAFASLTDFPGPDSGPDTGDCTGPDSVLPPMLMQAAVTYSGVAFKHLKAATLSTSEKEYANIHLWIASFMYGLLRPMDLILPYRMEGKVRLDCHGRKSMFDWWKPLLTDLLIDAVRDDDGILLWCSTDEMKRMVDWNRLISEVKVIEPEFLVDTGKTIKSMSVFSKMCRGAMARMMLQTALQTETLQSDRLTECLVDFNYEGFSFDSQRNAGKLEENHYIYTFTKR